MRALSGSTEQRFRSSPTQATAKGPSVLLRSRRTGEWLALEGTTRRIWELLEYPTSLAELTEALGADYVAEAATVRAGVRDLVEMLDGHGLIEKAGTPSPVRDHYLGLLKRAVGNFLYPELELRIRYLENGADGWKGRDLQRALRDIRTRQADDFERLTASKLAGAPPRLDAHSIIGMFRLDNLERCAERVFAEGVEGDFLEAGVCQGGASIFLRGLQVAHGETERRVWVVDSFLGVPPSVKEEDRRYQVHLEEEREPWLACDLQTVREHFRRYRLLDPQVRFVPGWLAESLPGAGIGPLALLRIDVDLHSATRECLELLYDKVSPGGYVVVDDYGFYECCRDAVDEFRARRGISEPLEWIDHSGIFWRKAGPDAAGAGR